VVVRYQAMMSEHARPPLPAALLSWETCDQAIPITQVGVNTVEYLFGLLGRRLVIIRKNPHHWGYEPVLGVINVEAIFVHPSY
jgi:hypothetical protein